MSGRVLPPSPNPTVLLPAGENLGALESGDEDNLGTYMDLVDGVVLNKIMLQM